MTAIRTSTLKRVRAYSNEIQKIMFQNEQIWPGEEIVEETPYITFTCDSEQNISLKPSRNFTNINDFPVNIEYSVNNDTWDDLPVDTSINFGGSLGNIKLRGTGNYSGTALNRNISYIIKFGNNTNLVYSDGDIRTLIDYQTFDTCDTSQARFCNLFVGYDAGGFTLPKSPLVTAPALPATTLADGCYANMFEACANLLTAPALPATTLSEGCYRAMFIRCVNLVNAPALPATTLTNGCYAYMFDDNRKLVNAPALPATTLADSCYFAMFMSCKSLENAPALPATTLARYCYRGMFESCKKLNYVKMMGIDISAAKLENPNGSSTMGWLYGVSPTGTFVKNAAATWDESSVIPSGWTVQTATT